MNILIVDDEELTRAGVIASVEWDKLGIDEIYQADDGIRGLAIAEDKHPNIILCDVRMPRMDGITMLERIEKKYPDTVVVFMSGYSDKEYLKAAIQLKAIDYIEKPIETKELNATLKKAVERCAMLALQNKADETHESTTASELAYRFTMPYRSNSEEVDTLCRELYERYGHGDLKYITTFIIKIRDIPVDPQVIPDLFEALQGYIKSMGLHAIYTEKKSYNVIIHIYGDIEPRRNTLLDIANKLVELMQSIGECYVSIGDTVKGKENAYKSYSQAVILLQSSFFRTPGDIIDATNEEDDSQPMTLDIVRDLSSSCMRSIEENSRDNTLRIIDELSKVGSSSGILENQIKAIYHDVLLDLYKIRRKQGLATDLSIENQETIMDTIDHCFCFYELHEILKDRVNNFFDDTEEKVTDDPTIRIICEYISDHYSSADLSVKSISDHAALSTSYACTFFKNEMGLTLNQYITDFRMKKAKQLLTDPRNKVTDISAAVGYSDGNYFAKSFRKYTGLSPSEYREQVIRS